MYWRKDELQFRRESRGGAQVHATTQRRCIRSLVCRKRLININISKMSIRHVPRIVNVFFFSPFLLLFRLPSPLPLCPVIFEFLRWWMPAYMPHPSLSLSLSFSYEGIVTIAAPSFLVICLPGYFRRIQRPVKCQDLDETSSPWQLIDARPNEYCVVRCESCCVILV